MELERLKKMDLVGVDDLVLGHYMHEGHKCMAIVTELEQLEAWERSMKYSQEEELEVFYDNKEIIKSNYEIVKLVAFERVFGEIILN